MTTGPTLPPGTIAEGDMVMLLDNKDRRYLITLEPGKEFHSHAGFVTHDELITDSPMHKGVSSGWPAILSSLKTLLETGAPMPMTTRRWGAPPS